MKVPMARTPGHQENNNFAAANRTNVHVHRCKVVVFLETQSGLGCPTSTGDHCRSSARRMGLTTCTDRGGRRWRICERWESPATGSCSVLESWSGSTLAAFTGFRRTVGATTLLGTRDP